jgi:hypothetical protein
MPDRAIIGVSGAASVSTYTDAVYVTVVCGRAILQGGWIPVSGSIM